MRWYVAAICIALGVSQVKAQIPGVVMGRVLITPVVMHWPECM
jgi:hypothetical protein